MRRVLVPRLACGDDPQRSCSVRPALARCPRHRLEEVPPDPAKRPAWKRLCWPAARLRVRPSPVRERKIDRPPAWTAAIVTTALDLETCTINTWLGPSHGVTDVVLTRLANESAKSTGAFDPPPSRARRERRRRLSEAINLVKRENCGHTPCGPVRSSSTPSGKHRLHYAEFMVDGATGNSHSDATSSTSKPPIVASLDRYFVSLRSRNTLISVVRVSGFGGGACHPRAQRTG